MVKNVELGFEELSSVLAYNPSTGEFSWRVTTSSRGRAGQRAGVWQRMQNGKDYYSITYKGRKYSGAQIAWLLHYGEWPDRSVFFIDNDPKNLRISNLKMADHKSIRVKKDDGSISYKMSKEQSRHYGLRRYYGMTLSEYAERYRLQGGVCAICKEPETSKDKLGCVRVLAVDHCHASGNVRELLCYACNSVLGQARDNPNILLAAADYLRKHAVSGSRTKADQTDRADAVQTVRPTLAQEV